MLGCGRSTHFLFNNLQKDCQVFFVSFIYAFNTTAERRPLWASLLALKDRFARSNSVPWVLMGDFNICLNQEKIEGGSRNYNLGMKEFKDFVAEFNVCDLNFTGKYLTWWDSNKENPTFKKLDGIMVNEEWLALFSLSRAHFMPRGLSCHCPAVLYLGTSFDKVFKPFQIFHHIINSPDFHDTVREAWNVVI